VQDSVHKLSQIRTPEEFAVWKQHEAVTGELIEEIWSAVRRLLNAGDFDSAHRLSDWFVLLAAGVDLKTQASAAQTRAITLFRTNQTTPALEYFDEAVRLYVESGDESSSARVRLDRISCYSHLGRYEEALHDAEITKEVFTRLGDKRRLAMTLNNYGEILFHLNRSAEWLYALEKAVALLQEIGDRQSLAIVCMNQAVALTSLNQTEEAIRYYKMSRESAEATGQTWLAACCNYNLGHLYYTLGEYTHALDIMSKTRGALAANPWYGALCDLMESEIYLEINMYRAAIQFAESAYTGFEKAQKLFDLARTIGVMAIARSQQHEFWKAERLFEQAKTMFKSQDKAIYAAGMDLHRSVMWLHIGRYADARDAAWEAYEAFIQEDGKSKLLVNVIIQPGTPYNAFVKENTKSKAAFARIICARASIHLGELDRAAGDAAIATILHEESPLPVVGYQLHALAGTIDAMRDNLETARTEYRRAIEDFEGVRANIGPDELRLNYLKDKVPVYEMLLGTDLRLWERTQRKEMVEEAFEAAERSKSRTLVDLLAGSVDALKRTDSSSVEEVRRALPSDTALIEYVIFGGTVIAFCISRSRFEVFRNLCPAEELQRRFSFLQFHLSRLSADPEAARKRPAIALANIQDHLRALYDMLVRPVEEFLAGMTSVVFVPSGILHYLPFHALYSEAGYLIDRFSISYAPAATMYELFVTRKRPANGDALLVGAPDEQAPLIASEIESIRSVLPEARCFVGPGATRECLRREMTSAGIIHIASHATFRPDNPMFSSFQLHDGPMNFFDIYSLTTSASLITLSGCGTGLSGVVAGDELLGLVRGFLYAGATSVVLSLWDVNDRSTADLMKYFYGYLAAGERKGESLRSAMLRLRQEHPHPYYWAPFLLMGDPS
jgi:tetratricopeptide (TPR) repeat protein